MMSMHAGWPSQADYIEALQDPAGAFLDPSLQAATIEADGVFGLPKPRSGQMASVYKLFDDRKTWAIRCFNFQSPARAARYRSISRFLARNPNRYTVDFGYIEDGIIVGSNVYPIVKMEWVEGDLLHTYIEKQLASPDKLVRLASTWVEMTRALHSLAFAHGDLQHGNVVVTRAGELKLIDYDGLFVPEFAGERSTEDGHPNYQHPCRRPRDFSVQLDNFSAWVVYLAIAAVAHDPSLWDELRFGDDCLALRRADYVRPSDSAAFAALKRTKNADVRNIARYVESLLSHEPARLPALESAVRGNAASRSEHLEERSFWPLSPFHRAPLPPGAYVEPYEPSPEPSPDPGPPASSSRVDPTLVRAGGGLVASIAGYLTFRELGFATDQYIAIVALGWILAGILLIATRGPKPPGAGS